MKYIFSPKNCIVLIFILLLPIYSFSQTKATYLGLDLSLESVEGEGIHPRMGVVYEKQLTKHSGLETGLYFRSFTYNVIANINDGTNSLFYSYSVSARYISIPLLYKFYTRIVNIAVGPAFDFYVGWEQKSGAANVKVNDVSISPAISYGLLTKISRRFNLNPRLLLETELIFNPFNSAGYIYTGLGVSVKYKL